MSYPDHNRAEAPAAVGIFLARFDDDESGATLTEFVVVLPVFLILFAGILKMTKIQSTTVQLEMAATGQLWYRAREVQQGTTSVDGSPRGQTGASGTRSDAIVGKRTGTATFSDDMDNALGKAGGLRDNGTLGESAAALRSGNAGGVEGSAQYDTTNFGPGVSGARSTENAYRRPGRTYRSPVTDDLVYDTGSMSPPPQANTPLGNMNISPSNSETTAAHAAGIRYGLVHSYKEAPAAALKGTPLGAGDLAAGYDVLVAPAHLSKESDRDRERRLVGNVRRSMASYRAYDELLGLQLSTPLF